MDIQYLFTKRQPTIFRYIKVKMGPTIGQLKSVDISLYASVKTNVIREFVSIIVLSTRTQCVIQVLEVLG
jgi:hypothetical protein